MLEGIINSYGISIPYDKFLIRSGGKINANKILKSLTIIEKAGFGKPKGSPLIVKQAYINKKGIITFPRIKIPIFLKHGIIDIIKIEYVNEPKIINNHIITIPLYDYQEDVISFLLKNQFSEESIKLGRAICYLQMDTGLGKSRIGCALINTIKYSALIVVPTIAIGYQWIDEINELYPTMTVGFYHNTSKIIVTPYSHDVTVIVVNTFSKKDISFINGYGIIIFDEVHEYYTNCNGKVLWLAQTKVVLGLSATPLERPDELDKYILLHLGNPLYAKDIVNVTSVKFKGNVKCINYYGSTQYSENILTEKGTTSSILTIGNLIKDPFRIQLIIKEAKRLYNDGHCIFVFAEHRDFLDILKNNLIGYSITSLEDTEIDYTDTSIFRGGINKSDIQHAKNLSKIKSHIVLTTYGYSRRGISLTEMTAIILATPRRNGLKQIIGRILRRGSDESIIRQIVDIVDIRCNLKNQYFDRKKVYIEKGYPITNVRIDSEFIEIEKNDDELSDNEYCIEKISQYVDDIYGSDSGSDL
jgi:superfamily II DNA or RNA helicase